MKFIKTILQSLNPKGWKTTKLNKQAKAALTLLIAEFQDCKDMTEVKSLIDCWIKANGLHPEEVETLSEAEFKAMFGEKTLKEVTEK